MATTINRSSSISESRSSRHSSLSFVSFPFFSLTSSNGNNATLNYDVECALPNVTIPEATNTKHYSYVRICLVTIFLMTFMGCLSTLLYFTLHTSANNTNNGNMKSSASTLYGICYSPFHHSLYGSSETMETVIDDDFTQIKNNFTLLRTYYSNYMGINIAAKAAQYNLQLALGVMMTVGNAPYAYLENEIEAAIVAGNNYSNSIETIFVGNENLKPTESSAWGSSSVYDILAVMNRIRSSIITPTIKIGTVQRINEWLIENEAVDMLANASDIIGVNIYPFFTTDAGDNEIEILDAQWDQMLKRFPNHSNKIRLTETGWPTNGTSNGNNVPNLKNASAYYTAVKQWIEKKGLEAYYFKYFDERTPIPMQADYEQFFGIADADGNKKFVEESTSIPTTAIPVTVAAIQMNTSNVSSSAASWYCMLNGIARKENCLNYSYTVGSSDMSKQMLCCSNTNGETCDALKALSWDNCDVSQFQSILTTPSTEKVENLQTSTSAWKCAQKINGQLQYSPEYCKIADMNALIASNLVSCYSNNTEMPWTSCNFFELQTLVNDSVVRMKNENEATVRVFIQQKPVDINGSSRYVISISVIAFSVVLRFLQF